MSSRLSRIIIILLFTLFLNKESKAQFWSETFSNGCASGCLASGYAGANGAWSVTNVGANGADANTWFVSGSACGNTAGACGTSCGATDPSLHVASVSSSPNAAVFCPTGDCGAAYDPGIGNGAVNTGKRVESPSINCTGQSSITLSFNYMEGGAAMDDATLWYFDGASWSQLSNTPATNNASCTPNGLWTAFSVNLPVSANNNPSVKIGFQWMNNDDGTGSPPSFAVDDIDLTAASVSIATGTVNGSPLCPCALVNVPYTSIGTFNAANTYMAQLSNAVGSFAAPTVIGFLASNANAGTINATLPCTTPAGTQYRIRVLSNNPAIVGTDNGTDLEVSASIAAAVSISASPSSTACQGINVTFTATNTNNLQSPTYAWFVNGAPVGSNSPTYTSNTLNNGDQVSCTISSSTGCVSGSPANSNTITMNITGAAISAAVSISANLNPVCTGTSVTFTATNTNAIPSPSYQWSINGAPVGGTSSTYTYVPANGDLVQCFISSSNACVSGSPAISNTVVMSVTNSMLLSCSITASDDTICQGQAITFNAVGGNGGNAPIYTWTVNGANVGSGTTYSSSSLNTGDVVLCTLQSSWACAISNPALSNPIMPYVIPNGTPPTVTITSNPSGTICPNMPVTFTATATIAGTNPTYNWILVGVGSMGTGSTYTNTTLTNGDQVYCIVTSNSLCNSGLTATSNTITIDMQYLYAAGVSINPSVTTVCAGDPVTITATPSNAGTPTYLWTINGGVPTQGTDVFTSTSLQNGDVITCLMFFTDPCASGSQPEQSNTVTMVVEECPLPEVHFSASQTALCEGTCINFTDMTLNSPTSWSWTFEGANPSSSTDQNPTNICYDAAGSYAVTLFATNFRGSDELIESSFITVESKDTLKASDDVEILSGSSTTLQVSGGSQYTWSPSDNLSCADCASPVASPSVSTTYIVTDATGCTGSDTVLVKVFDEYILFIPQAFSPNGDGQNDILYVRGNGIRDLSFLVYDRLGERVFLSNGPDFGWDGSYRGKTLNPGVFTYMVEATMQDGSVKKLKGNVTLIR